LPVTSWKTGLHSILFLKKKKKKNEISNSWGVCEAVFLRKVLSKYFRTQQQYFSIPDSPGI